MSRAVVSIRIVPRIKFNYETVVFALSAALTDSAICHRTIRRSVYCDNRIKALSQLSWATGRNSHTFHHEFTFPLCHPEQR